MALVHELQVHQIELEMQNEELKRAKLETEDALAKYSDLYDFAPIGLFAIDLQGLIREVNLAGAALLGIERRNLMNRHFRLFVAPKDRSCFDESCKSAFETSTKQTCELNLLRDGEPTVYASIEGIATEDGSMNGRQCRIAVINITERKQAESILERYQLISKYARDIVLLMGRDGHIIEANEAAINAYGYTRDELLSKNISDLRDTKTLEKISNQMQLVDSEGLLFETEHRRKDGSTFPVEVSSRGTVIEGWRVLLSIIRDITERNKAENAMRQSEQRYRDLFESMDEGFALCEMIYDKAGKPVDFRYLSVNPAFAKLTGLPVEQVAGRTVRELIPGIEPFWIETYGRVVHSGISERIDNPVATLGRHYEVYVWRSGIGRFAVVFSDITERKRMEKELRETRDYLENLINYANAPIIVWDASFRITRLNHAFERLTGFRATEAIGEPLNNLFPESSREGSMDLIGRTLSGERWEAVEIPVLCTDGSVRTVLWSSANIYDKDGTTVVSTVAQGQDITERKKMEGALRAAHDQLELKVQERTAELQNALETAKESVRAKAAFLANMSHELRTPLNAVIGFSSLLLDDNLTQDQKEDIESIKKGGEALLDIIDDILEFSRAEKEKVELAHQPLSLKHCIEESLDMVAVQASKKGLNLSQTINYSTPDTIIGDHCRLRQILVNLLSNAVKFTDKGNVSLSVSSKAVVGNQRQIFFKVKDTGIGIPQNRMNEIFEPFAQVERTISRKRDGVGLGLAITKNLVELMGGTIWAESIQGQGTTFHFMILAETIPGKQLNFGKMNRGVASESFPRLKPMRILVAEDNPSNQRVLVEMLKRLGYRPDAVADGREVIQALERQDYDLVLMDIKMPEMDGITATQVIRKLRPENGPKIVAITAFALEGDREKCLEAGMDDYIAKPVQMENLAEVLKRCAPEIQ